MDSGSGVMEEGMPLMRSPMPPPLALAREAAITSRGRAVPLGAIQRHWRQCKFVGVLLGSALALAASFALGHMAGRSASGPQPVGASSNLEQADLDSRIVEFTVPMEPGDAERFFGPASSEAQPAPERRLQIEINLPSPMSIVPPNMRPMTARDSQLMRGALSMDHEAVRTKYLRWYDKVGCFRLSESDRQRETLPMKFHDFSCMEANGNSAQNPCASGLPFYRMVMQARQSHQDCLIFCLSKGLDLFGVLHISEAQQAKAATVGDFKHECRCGASERNKAVWNDEAPDPKKSLNMADKREEGSPECRLYVWEYTGPMPDGAVPFQVTEMSVADEGYTDSITRGQMRMGLEEDTTNPRRPELHLDRDMNLVKYVPGHSRRLGTCQDDSDTGVTIDGRPASCGQLTSYCRQSSSTGEHVRNVCPLSCGVCSANGWLPCYPYQCSGGRPWTTKASNGLVYIPFYFCGNIDNTRRQAFRIAAMEFQQKTCIRFSEQNGGTPRLKVCVRDPNSCDATVGYPGEGNEADLNMGWCRSMNAVGSLIHELGHVIGMNHEQNRADGAQRWNSPEGPKGNFINVFWNNIAPSWHSQFVPIDESYVGSNNQGRTEGGGVDTWEGYAPYDYESIMHYGRPSPSGGGLAFSTVNPTFNSVVGQRTALSQGDLRQIADMYQCRMDLGSTPPQSTPLRPPAPTPPAPTPPSPSAPPTPTQPPQPGPTPSPQPSFGGAAGGRRCRDINPFRWLCNGKPCMCRILRGYCRGSYHSPAIRRSCPVTCGVCDQNRCTDTPPEGWKCNGAPCSCDTLSGYCRDPIYGPEVMASCRATCGTC